MINYESAAVPKLAEQRVITAKIRMVFLSVETGAGGRPC
jgi:hypothetical protein